MVRLTEGISGLLESILRLVIAAGSTLPAFAQLHQDDLGDTAIRSPLDRFEVEMCSSSSGIRPEGATESSLGQRPRKLAS